MIISVTSITVVYRLFEKSRGNVPELKGYVSIQAGLKGELRQSRLLIS